MTTQHEPANAVYAYVEAFIDELARAGLRHVVICPGSRSTPLALSFAEHDSISVWMHIDERSAAYFALGMAKRGRQPVALLCTSGTAAANFYPAIIEAKLARVPLLVLTADRPHELRDNGAPQAIDQNRLFGSYPKWFVDVALPEATNAALRYIRTLAARAAALTQAIPAGPVHCNFPFRDPLTPDSSIGQTLPLSELRDPIAWYGRPGGAPYVTVNESPFLSPAGSTIRSIADQLHAASRGLIIAGPQDDPELALSLASLAECLNYPILADPLSQVRCGPHNRALVLASYDAFLRDESFAARARPHAILRFGAMPTSKPILLYLQRYPTCPQIVIDGYNGWEEPTQSASTMIHADPAAFCRELVKHIQQEGQGTIGRGQASPLPSTDQQDERRGCEDKARASIAPTLAFTPHNARPDEDDNTAWLRLWLETDRVTRSALDTAMHLYPPFFEGRVFSELNALLPDRATLYVGNSMPVRDLDTFFWGSERLLHILGNRGANGIDGVTSSALGASAAVPEWPTLLVTGDLSFLHDLNGLLAARLHGLKLTIILINNDGGGIFSFLPQAAHPQRFEQLFGTPTGLDLRPAVEMYGGTFERVENWKQFRAAVQQGITGTGLRVIEVRSERESNVTLHRQLWQAVTHALQHTSGADGTIAPSHNAHSYSASSRDVVVNGVTLHAELREPAQPAGTLMLLHGFTGSASSWGNHLDTFAGAGLRVIALDLLGHGASDAPADPQRYSMEHCRADILAALRVLEVSAGEAILLGYSMGGRIALYTALQNECKAQIGRNDLRHYIFRGLILESASPGLAGKAEREQRRAQDNALAGRIERAGVENFVDYWEQLPLFASQRALPGEVREQLRRQRLANRAAGLASSLRGVGAGAQPALHSQLPELALPTLLIAGELDTKFSALARQMARAMPQAQAAIVPGAGHSIHLEQPGIFDSLVLDFCRTCLKSVQEVQ